MKILKKEVYGIQEVYNTNVSIVHNYITENGIINHNCVIDSDYQGEVHLHVYNTSRHTIYLSPGDKLVQAIHLPYFKSFLHESKNEEELYRFKKSKRGAGGFGHTGDK